MSKNLALRLIVAAAGIPLLLAVCYLNDIYLFIFCIILAGLAGLELAMMFKKAGFGISKILSAILPVSCVISAYYNYSVANIILLSFFLISLVSIIKYSKKSVPDLSGFFNDLAGGLIPVLYPGLLVTYVIFLGKLPENGGLFLILVFCIVWATDTAAYFGGKAFGKSRLTVNISPKKTWAGFYFGFVGAIIAGIVCKLIFLNISWLQVFVISIITCLAGQIGDLLESAIKRYCQVKDSSAILPGHGGILDRFDSFFFAVPAVYFMVIYWP